MFLCACPAGRVMIPIALATLAVACLLLAALALRRVGPGYRVARLLASTPQVELAQAIELATGGATRYVRISGRISSDEEFPDEHDRPLVYRRRRLEVADQRGRWQTIAQDSEAVPFGLELRGHFLALDGAALGDGLVVVPREALGKAHDLGPELAAEHPPEAASRLVIEQVSAVEQATAVGVPVLDPDGQPLLSAGLGRPLILTTLATPDAMRLLAAGRRRLVLLAGGLILGALIFGVAGLLTLIVIG